MGLSIYRIYPFLRDKASRKKKTKEILNTRREIFFFNSYKYCLTKRKEVLNKNFKVFLYKSTFKQK